MDKYDFKTIEKKWREAWDAADLFTAKGTGEREKCYVLTMYPYPSGVLHMGHVINYTIGDVVVRYNILRGYDVLSPMGWDSFGLPAENAAMRTGVHPHDFTEKNIARMKQQMAHAGWGYDWSCEVATSHTDYYHWTQWFFLQFHKMGMAVKKTAPVNWCPHDKTVLANEQVHDGCCERCGTEVEQKAMSQWFFAMSKYAQRLLDGHEQLRGQWPDDVLAMQKEWIGRSEGARVVFKVKETDEELPIFTTRPDTLFGVTFMSLAPEHPLIEKLVKGTPQEEQVMKEVQAMRRQSASERERSDREKVGVWTGFHVVNPVNGDEVPLWVANFALMTYGTGAVMAVPAHDQRDFEFARTYGLPIKVVIQPSDRELDPATMTEAYVDPGAMIASGLFNGRNNREAMSDIIRWLADQGYGEGTINYRLRDWLISRQRYWGAPIPMIYCDVCGLVPVPEQDLPVLLPTDVTFSEEGGNPLEKCEAFVQCTCPKCGKAARRETDTMDTFVDSSWYFLRYCDPTNAVKAFDSERVRKWMPVDHYIGGIEHATMHLIYARFFTMLLHDLGLIDFSEPFKRLFCQGMVCKTAYYCDTDKWLHEDDVKGERKGDQILDPCCAKCGASVEATMTKISKTKLNIVDPDEMFDQYGADTMRLYMLSDAPPDQAQVWSEAGINGAWRMLNRLWDLVQTEREQVAPIDAAMPADLDDTNRTLRRKAHQCIQSATREIEGGFKFNTAIARCNELLKMLRSAKSKPLPAVLREVLETIVRLLSPIVPHFAEELWQALGHNKSIFAAGWPEADEEIAKEEELKLAVQVNGKVRGHVTLPADVDRNTIEAAALELDEVKKWTQGKQIRKVIVVPGRLVNIAAS